MSLEARYLTNSLARSMLAGSLPLYFFYADLTKFEACSLTTENCVLDSCAVRRCGVALYFLTI